MSQALARHESPEAAGVFTRALLDFIGTVPGSDEPRSARPADRARDIAASAGRKAGVVAGTLALPPGPLGWLTIIPELLAVWRIQAKMVADIAGCYGKTALLSREQMLYCLFRHAAAQAVRDLVVRAGERMLIRKASARVFEDVASRVGMRVTQKAFGKGVARFFPAIGALAVGGYAYWDTMQVGQTAAGFFGSDVTVEK